MAMPPNRPKNLPHWDLSNVYSSGSKRADYRPTSLACSYRSTDLERLFERARHSPPVHRNLAATRPESLGATLAQALSKASTSLSRLAEHAVAVRLCVLQHRQLRHAGRPRGLEAGTSGRRGRQNCVSACKAGSAAWRPSSTVWIAARPTAGRARFFLRDSGHRSRLPDGRGAGDRWRPILCSTRASRSASCRATSPASSRCRWSATGRPKSCRSRWCAICVSIADPAVRERAYRAELHGWESIRTHGGGLPERRQRNRADAGPAARLAERAGRGAGRQPHRPPDAGRHARSDPRGVSDVSPLSASQGSQAGPASNCAGGTSLPRWAGGQRISPGLEAREFIVEKFGTFSTDLGQYAAAGVRPSLDRRRAARRQARRRVLHGGDGVEESRILANFDGSFDQVSTLAHELGHGYHNHCQRGLAPLLRGAPMTLGRNGQHLLRDAGGRGHAGEAPRPSEQLAILEAQLCGATQVCLDITSRFLFESALFDARGRRAN